MIAPEEISFIEGVDFMTSRYYNVDEFVPRWEQWLDRGDVVLIFENADLGHQHVGRAATMPWFADPAESPYPAPGYPPHMPDHSETGLGWRYVTKYVIKQKGA